VTSLDAPADADAKNAQDKEIRRHLCGIDAGTGKPIDRDEFQHRMQARLNSHSCAGGQSLNKPPKRRRHIGSKFIEKKENPGTGAIPYTGYTALAAICFDPARPSEWTQAGEDVALRNERPGAGTAISF
jgi:hypothetical protein